MGKTIVGVATGRNASPVTSSKIFVDGSFGDLETLASDLAKRCFTM